MGIPLVTLDHLQTGARCIVCKIDTDSHLKQRLFDLGISEDAHLEVSYKSPSGDPVAYNVRGAVIALRREISKLILVEECSHEKSPGENDRFGRKS